MNQAPMAHDPTNLDKAPSAERLAAFVDGELEAAACERIEAWLSDHPEAGAACEEQRRLLRYCQQTTPPEPASQTWAAVLRHIEVALSPHALVPRTPRRPSRRWLLMLTATAALLALVLLGRAWRLGPSVPGETPRPAPAAQRTEEADDAYPVATALDVNILTVDAREADSLLLGHPPLGNVEFATPDDVNVIRVEPSPVNGQSARFEKGPVPMIVSALLSPEEP